MSIVNLQAMHMEALQRAIVIKPNVDNFEIALAKSLLISIIQRTMEKRIVNFIYYRSNGDLIEAYGTTNQLIIGKDGIKVKPSCNRKNTTLFYDVELEKWKAFRWENQSAS